MKVELTQPIVDKLAFEQASPDKKQVVENWVFDVKQRGLVVRVFKSGEKTFYVKCPTGRIKLDSCSAI
jgi:hypothetical protein